jgi:hypothetical protein
MFHGALQFHVYRSEYWVLRKVQEVPGWEIEQCHGQWRRVMSRELVKVNGLINRHRRVSQWGPAGAEDRGRSLSIYPLAFVWLGGGPPLIRTDKCWCQRPVCDTVGPSCPPDPRRSCRERWPVAGAEDMVHVMWTWNIL